MRRRIITVLTVFALLTAARVCAQQIVAEATVPFNFMVANSVLPAGNYQILPCNAAAIMIRNCDSNATVLAAASPNYESPFGPAALVFHQYGNQYFLREVHVPNAQGATLPVSAREKAAKLESATVRTTQRIFVPAK